jgi:hypothetical protein
MITSKSILLPRMCVIALLAGIYTLGFIVTPYWIRTNSTSEMIFILALTVGIGAIWSFLSAKDLEVRLEPLNWWQLLILLAGLVILNFKALTIDIPWRGDEGIHITRTLALVSNISIIWVLAFIIVFISTAMLAWKKSKWSILLGILSIAGVISFNIVKNPLTGISSSILMRYPFINYWFYAIIPSLAMAIKVNPYQEVFFRMVPFLSTFALVWIFQRDLCRSKPILNLFWGLAVASIPLVYYYSSILYIEMPAIALMLIVCLNIPSLLKDDFQKIKQNPAWYALILTGFIKETTIPFLVCFVGWRLIASAVQGRISLKSIKTSLRSLEDELLIAVSVLMPVSFYLFLRGTLSQQARWFSLTLANLSKPIVYSTLLRSFTDQLGLPFLLLFCASCFFLFWKKEFLQAGFFLTLFVLYPAFFAVDTLIYTGYSRFNLFIIPPVLAGAWILIKRLMENRKIIGTITACAILAINLWTSPVYIDGTKKPLWGNYLTDTSEHYYPYREALTWLKTKHGNEPIMFAGMYYPYPFVFYFDQLEWTTLTTVSYTNYVDSNSLSLSRALVQAEDDNINIILFQVLGNERPEAIASGPLFHVEKIFQNDAQILIVYHRNPRSG